MASSISFSGFQDCNMWNSWQSSSITNNRSFGYTRKTGSKADYRLLLRVTLKAEANKSIDSFSVCLNIYPSAGTQNPNPSKNFGVEGYLYDNESVLKTNLLNPPGGYISYAAESTAPATTRAGRKFTITFSNVHCTSTVDKYYYIWVGGIAASNAWLMEFWGGTGCSVAIVSTSTLAGAWRKPLSLAWSPTKSSNGYYSGLRAIDQKFTISVPSGYYAYGSQDNSTYYRKSNLIYDVQTSMTANSILRYASCNSVNTDKITASLSSTYYSTIYLPRLCFSGFFDKEYCINTMQYSGSNSKITAPSISSLSGWIFLGYRTSTSAPTSDSVNYTTWATSSPNNIALYGLLKKILTFNPNGGSSNGSTSSKTYTEYKYGTSSGLSTTGNYSHTANRTGYTFSCWVDSDGDEYSSMADAFKRANSGSTLTAVWTANSQTNNIEHWALGFQNGEGNNGTKNAFKFKNTTFSAYTDASITLNNSRATTIPNGYDLMTNISTNSVDNTGAWTSHSLPFTTTQKPNSMLFQYGYIPFTYNITYNLDGGINNSTNPSTYTVLYGVTFSNPTKTGYIFSHWTDANGTTITGINPGANAFFSSGDDLYSKLSTRTIGDQTVTAHWTMITYNIGYNLNGGNLADQSINSNKVIVNPRGALTYNPANGDTIQQNYFQLTFPTKIGYKFIGWTITGMDTSPHRFWYKDNDASNSSWHDSNSTSFNNLNINNKNLYVFHPTATDGATITITANWQFRGNYIYKNDTDKWVKVVPFVYNGSTWRETQPFVYTSNGWKSLIN